MNTKHKNKWRESAYTCATDGAVGREVTALREQPPMISIKLDDALTHSIGSDVKHDKNVPDSISAHSSQSYQRASSVSRQNKPLRTHRHTPLTHLTAASSHCIGISDVSLSPGGKVYLKRKHQIFFFFPFGSSSFLASLVKHTTLILFLLPGRGKLFTG